MNEWMTRERERERERESHTHTHTHTHTDENDRNSQRDQRRTGRFELTFLVKHSSASKEQASVERKRKRKRKVKEKGKGREREREKEKEKKKERKKEKKLVRSASACCPSKRSQRSEYFAWLTPPPIHPHTHLALLPVSFLCMHLIHSVPSLTLTKLFRFAPRTHTHHTDTHTHTHTHTDARRERPHFLPCVFFFFFPMLVHSTLFLLSLLSHSPMVGS